MEQLSEALGFCSSIPVVGVSSRRGRRKPHEGVIPGGPFGNHRRHRSGEDISPTQTALQEGSEGLVCSEVANNAVMCSVGSPPRPCGRCLPKKKAAPSPCSGARSSGKSHRDPTVIGGGVRIGCAGPRALSGPTPAGAAEPEPARPSCALTVEPGDRNEGSRRTELKIRENTGSEGERNYARRKTATRKDVP